jgi:hypothetical protein
MGLGRRGGAKRAEGRPAGKVIGRRRVRPNNKIHPAAATTRVVVQAIWSAELAHLTLTMRPAGSQIHQKRRRPLRIGPNGPGPPAGW